MSTFKINYPPTVKQTLQKLLELQIPWAGKDLGAVKPCFEVSQTVLGLWLKFPPMWTHPNWQMFLMDHPSSQTQKCHIKWHHHNLKQIAESIFDSSFKGSLSICRSLPLPGLTPETMVFSPAVSVAFHCSPCAATAAGFSFSCPFVVVVLFGFLNSVSWRPPRCVSLKKEVDPQATAFDLPHSPKHVWCLTFGFSNSSKPVYNYQSWCHLYITELQSCKLFINMEYSMHMKWRQKGEKTVVMETAGRSAQPTAVGPQWGEQSPERTISTSDCTRALLLLSQWLSVSRKTQTPTTALRPLPIQSANVNTGRKRHVPSKKNYYGFVINWVLSKVII